jgi:prepilin-type N-terminal cleavage/methylation domain-containing protein/prepilin-type processing-associated H-X9-DG protein
MVAKGQNSVDFPRRPVLLNLVPERTARMRPPGSTSLLCRFSIVALSLREKDASPHKDVSPRKRFPLAEREGYYRAFTLVELLVVIAIIGILAGLILPAVQMAREAGRRTQCQNHLKQLGVATLLHHDVQQHFPTGGWGYRWVGDATRGFGEAQPGGWIFNILPFIEQENLRSQATDATRQQMLTVPLELLICPSRRSAGLYPYGETMFGLANCPAPASAAKSDYAICAGDDPQPGGSGPADTSDASYVWPSFQKATGISFVRTRIGLEHVKDGASNTVMIGEKHLPYAEYDTGQSLGDDQTMLHGDDADIRRWMSGPPLPDSTPGEPDRFGGPHAGGAYFVFCDGGVRLVASDLDADACRNLGNRRDGKHVNLD